VTATPWRLLAETLEARILHSADLSPLGWSASPTLHPAANEATLAPAAASATTQAATQRAEIAFIDAGLPDADALAADLLMQQAAGRRIEVVTIDSSADGLALMSQTLAGRSDIGAVHVLSHGSDGHLQLGRTVLDAQTLMQRAAEIAGWSEALTADADLLLYGCDVAQGAAGRQLVHDLAALTGADVAASTDLTGAAARGGDWALERLASVFIEGSEGLVVDACAFSRIGGNAFMLSVDLPRAAPPHAEGRYAPRGRRRAPRRRCRYSLRHGQHLGRSGG
jgi:hypothetical protein